MKQLFTLGELYPSDFIEIEQSPRSQKVELNLILTDDGNVRLEKSAPLNMMYGKYWYRSSINSTMKIELNDIVNSILKIKKLEDNDVWVDIAANDGTLLSFVPKNLIRIGIDPADDSYKTESEKYANLIVQDYFSASKFKSEKYGKFRAKVITSIAMFYDLENPNKFINDINEILDDDGIWCLQLSYTPLMIEQVAFDNICHEHIFYYSLFNIKKLFEKYNLQIMDCQLNDINGGSFRIYVMKRNANIKKFGTQPYRDVCNFRVKSILEYEKNLKLDDENTWLNFFNKINELKEQTVSFIKEEKSKGKVIYGYGASTKGNTLLQYFGLDNSLIDGIAERSLYKFGLKTAGTNIPICSEQDMRKIKPDYLLVLPWHFINEFMIRESELLQSGTKFIVPCPKFEVVSIP